MFPSDPRALPIVYDTPACAVIESTTSLLDCPRLGGSGTVNGGEIGSLGNGILGSNALAFVVGVSCEEGKLGI